MDIVETLHKYLKGIGCDSNVHLVLHKKITPAAMKAYKEYNYTLWYINKENRYPVTRIVHIARVTTDKEDRDVTDYMEEQLLIKIFSLLRENRIIKPMLDGSFVGYGTECAYKDQ